MTQNILLASTPKPGPRAFIMANPRWMRLTFRVAMFLVGPLAMSAILSADAPLPLAGLVVSSVASILTFCIALWPQPWS